MPVTNKEGTTCTSIFHCNIRSIRKNANLLVSFLAQQEHIFDVLATTETWLKPGENITIPGYTLISNARVSRSRGGGVALFIKSERSFSILSGVTCSTPFIESLFVVLESSLIIGVVYRSPNSCVNSFLEKFETIFSSVTHDHKGVIAIVGGINIDTHSAMHRNYEYLLRSFDFHNLITEPTRVTASSATLLDHALSNRTSGVTAGVYNQAICDHLPIFIKVNYFPKPRQESPKLVNKINYDLLRDNILSLNFDEIYHNDVNIEFSNFINVLTGALAKSSQNVSPYSRHTPVCPWMNRATLEAIKTKDYWYHKWRHNRKNQYYFIQFKAMRNKLVAMLRTRKKEYYASRIQQANGNTKKIWDIVKEVAGKPPPPRVLPDIVDSNAVGTFNYTFASMATTLGQKLPPASDELSLATCLTNSFAMFDIDVKEIQHVVSCMTSNKSVGIDGITPRMIKENVHILGPILCHLFNHAVKSIYPSSLKIAKVVPIYKKGTPRTL